MLLCVLVFQIEVDVKILFYTSVVRIYYNYESWGRRKEEKKEWENEWGEKERGKEGKGRRKRRRRRGIRKGKGKVVS